MRSCAWLLAIAAVGCGPRSAMVHDVTEVEQVMCATDEKWRDCAIKVFTTGGKYAVDQSEAEKNMQAVFDLSKAVCRDDDTWEKCSEKAGAAHGEHGDAGEPFVRKGSFATPYGE